MVLAAGLSVPPAPSVPTVSKTPPMEFGSPLRSKRTRTLGMGVLLSPRARARRLAKFALLPTAFTDTTLGFTLTEKDLIRPGGTTGTPEPPADWTVSVGAELPVASAAPPAVATDRK